MKLFQVCAVILLTLYKPSACDVIAKTKLGEIEGMEYMTDNGRTVFGFLGVPYAKPPVGDLRFKEPVPQEKWRGRWVAKSSGAACQQLSYSGEFQGNEDCLYIDVYTPSLVHNASLPVLVYFHGGAFMQGMGSVWAPRFILDGSYHDIVYVTVNYRLGPLGFLSTEDSVVPGNNGLKDQVLALEWVRENIAAFNGDKDSVTISGSSAGGASVNYHYLSLLSRHLFARGISASGCALNNWALAEQPLQKAKRLASLVGCPTGDNSVMVDCMRKRPGKQLNLAVNNFMPWVDSPFSPFGPVVERSGDRPFLNRHPLELILRGKAADRPWLVSVTTQEGLYPGAFFIDREALLQELSDNWHDIAPFLMDYNYTCSQKNMTNVSDAIKAFYFGDKNVPITASNRDRLIDMLSDRLFRSDISYAARLQASRMSSPVFFFSLGYRGTFSLSQKLAASKTDFGVSHMDDAFYIFGFKPSSGTYVFEEADKPMAWTMQQLWMSFVKTGRPIARGAPWLPVDPTLNENLNYLYIKSPTDIFMTYGFDFGNHTFWSSLGLAENLKSIFLQEKNGANVINCHCGLMYTFVFLYTTILCI